MRIEHPSQRNNGIEGSVTQISQRNRAAEPVFSVTMGELRSLQPCDAGLAFIAAHLGGACRFRLNGVSALGSGGRLVD